MVSAGLDIQSIIPEPLVPVATQMQQDLSLMQQFNDPNGYYTLCLPCQVQ